MNLFYHPEIDLQDNQIVFDKEESRHISKVLRYKIGDVVWCTDGKGHIVKGRISMVAQKESVAAIEGIEDVAPLPYQLHMAVAPTKNNDRFEWFLEKATEIGVHSITPIFCDHSERRMIKPERLDKIMESAMKQSLKAYKPLLRQATSFSEFLKQDHQPVLKCLAHCEAGAKTLLQLAVPPKTNVLIAIGPEGDFSMREIEWARDHDFVEVSLGDSRLRTETAAIVACHTISLLNG